VGFRVYVFFHRLDLFVCHVFFIELLLHHHTDLLSSFIILNFQLLDLHFHLLLKLSKRDRLLMRILGVLSEQVKDEVRVPILGLLFEPALGGQLPVLPLCFRFTQHQNQISAVETFKLLEYLFTLILNHLLGHFVATLA